jgi:HK97 family phage major capsid protein
MKSITEIAAEKFGVAVGEVTQAHLDMVTAIAKEVAEANGEADRPGADLNKKLLEDLQAKLAAETAEKEKALRLAAEAKAPELDPEEAVKHEKALSKTKTLPDIMRAVYDDNEGENDVRAFRKEWDMLHVLTQLSADRRGMTRPVSSLKYWARMERRFPDFVKAVDTATASGGAEWAPDVYSSDLQNEVYDRTVVAQQFTRVNSPDGPAWVLPFSPTGGTMYLAGESTTDGASDFTSTTPGSRAVTITPIKGVIRIPYSEEFEEDSIVAAAPLFRETTVRIAAEHIDSAIVNGDITSPHQDTGKSYTSTSMEAAFSGLRDIGMNTLTSCSLDCSSFYGDKVFQAMNLMDDRFIQNPSDLMILTSVKSRKAWTQMRDTNASGNQPVYMRDSAMGDEMVRQGAFMDFYGTPVIASHVVWSDMNASGVYDNSTKIYGAIIIVHRPSFLLTDRRALKITGYDQPLKGLKNVITSWRGSFDSLQATTSKYCVVGYKVAT